VTDFARTTDLGIGAHPDDLEIMAAGPIVECHADPGRAFGGVVCTDGRRSPRGGRFATFTDDELAAIRRAEQAAAAEIGGYAGLVQLGRRSEDVVAEPEALVDELTAILVDARPRVVYTHEPGDSHATHVAVCEAVVTACRRVPAAARPTRVVGCESWHSLAAIPVTERVDVEWDADVALERALLAAHASQVEGGPVDVEAEMTKRRVRAGRHRTRAVDLTGQVDGGAR
jgi:LmbE family N-acetylglucosaminyl deacetylase